MLQHLAPVDGHTAPRRRHRRGGFVGGAVCRRLARAGVATLPVTRSGFDLLMPDATERIASAACDRRRRRRGSGASAPCKNIDMLVENMAMTRRIVAALGRGTRRMSSTSAPTPSMPTSPVPLTESTPAAPATLARRDASRARNRVSRATSRRRWRSCGRPCSMAPTIRTTATAPTASGGLRRKARISCCSARARSAAITSGSTTSRRSSCACCCAARPACSMSRPARSIRSAPSPSGGRGFAAQGRDQGHAAHRADAAQRLPAVRHRRDARRLPGFPLHAARRRPDAKVAARAERRLMAEVDLLRALPKTKRNIQKRGEAKTPESHRDRARIWRTLFRRAARIWLRRLSLRRALASGREGHRRTFRPEARHARARRRLRQGLSGQGPDDRLPGAARPSASIFRATP